VKERSYIQVDVDEIDSSAELLEFLPLVKFWRKAQENLET